MKHCPQIYPAPNNDAAEDMRVFSQKDDRSGTSRLSPVLIDDSSSGVIPHMIHVVPEEDDTEDDDDAFNLEELPSLLEAAIAQSAEREKQVELSRAALIKALQSLDSPKFQGLEKCLSVPVTPDHQEKAKTVPERQGPLSLFLSDVNVNSKSPEADDEQVLEEDEGQHSLVKDIEETDTSSQSLDAMQLRIDRLTHQVNVLEEQNVQIRAERDELEQEQVELLEHFSFLSAQYAEASARERRQISEYDGFKTKFRRLKSVHSKRMNLIEEELLQAKEELKKNKSNSEGAISQQEHEQLKEKVEHMSMQCEERCARESKLNAGFDPFEAKVQLFHDLNSERTKSLEKTIGQLKQDLKETLGRENIFEARCETYTEEVVSLQSTFMKERNYMEDSVHIYQQKLVMEVSTTETLKSQVESLRYALANTEKENEELLTDNNFLRNQKMETDHYKAANQKLAHEAEVVAIANDRLEKNIKSLDERSIQKHQVMLKKNAWLDEQLRNSQKRILELESKIKESVELRAITDAETRDRQRDHEASLTTARNETEELRDKLAEAKALNASLSKERDALLKEVDGCKSEIEELRGERDSLRQRDEQLGRDVGSLWGW